MVLPPLATPGRISSLRPTGPEPLEARIAPAVLPGVDAHNLNGTDGFHVIDSGADAGFAVFTVEHVGDVNGDHVDDVLLFRHYNVEDNNGDYIDHNDAFVVFGKKGAAFPTTVDVATLDGTNGFAINDSAGRELTVAGPGDVNGDGFADLLIGLPSNATGVPGRAVVLYGSATPGARVDMATDPAPARGFAVTGVFEEFGAKVSATGDVNGDGYADFAVLSYGIFNVFPGSALPPQVPLSEGGGLVTLYAPILAPVGDLNYDGVDDMVSLPYDATEVHGKYSSNAYVVFGQKLGFDQDAIVERRAGAGFNILGLHDDGTQRIAASGGGDFNGDGIADLALGQRGADEAPGKVSVIFGHAGAYPATFNLASLNGRNGATFVGRERYDGFGETVDLTGDVNGDGLADLLAETDVGNIHGAQGRVHVFFGHAGMFKLNETASQLNGVNGFTVEDHASEEPLGGTAHRLGDVNGDGLGDFAVAFNSPVSVVFGHASDPNVSAVPGALAIAPDGHSASFTEADGDHVTVYVNKGRLTPANFTLVAPSGQVADGLQWIGLSFDGDRHFAGASVRVVATPGATGGDGHVDLETLRADGLDLAQVTLPGRLGQIVVGDKRPSTPALLTLQAEALGLDAASTLPDGIFLESDIAGRAGDLTFTGDIRAAQLTLHGSVHALNIGGSLIGRGAEHSGAILGDRFSVGTLTIGGDVRGGSGDESGYIDLDGVGRLQMAGQLTGGDGENSGEIFSFLYLAGTITGGIKGGNGWSSGLLVSVRFGPLQVGFIEGGEGLASGALAGGVATRLSVIGDVKGGPGYFSGQINMVNDPRGRSSGLSRIDIGGSLIAGAGPGSGRVTGQQVASLNIHQDVRGGEIGAETIGQLTIGGAVMEGADGRRAEITAIGKRIGHPALAKFAFLHIDITGGVRNADILAGYSSSGYFNPITAVSGDARIGTVKVGGDWVASNLVAGVQSGSDGLFGVNQTTSTSDDALIAGHARYPAAIASVTIGGSVSGSAAADDHFAFTAQRIDRFSIHGVALAMTAGPSTMPISGASDVVIREIAGPKPAVPVTL